MITYPKDTKKESERIRQMDGRTKMLIQMRVKKWLCTKKWWYNENNGKHMFHKIQRSRFIMSPSTGKYKLLCGVHAYVAVGKGE
jgi:hypothetical protein